MIAVNIINARSKVRKEERDGSIKEYEDYIRVLKEDFAECKKEITQLREELKRVNESYSKCMVEHERTSARLEFLTEMMRNAGMEVKPWNPEGSDIHRPLPTELDRRKGEEGYDGPERRDAKPKKKGT